MGDNPFAHLPDEELERLSIENRLALLRAEQREQFLYFCDDPQLFEGEPPARHHAVICEVLQQVAEGKLKRVMIFAPPGSAKSTYSSVRFSTWLMGVQPKIKLICASHTKGLAARHGRMVRNIIDRAEYREIFPDVALSPDSKARDDWGTQGGGELFAIGFDGAIAGRRADGLLIDDPYTGRADADSEVIRERSHEVFKDLRDRLRKDGWIVIINTRWHGDDLCGRILPKTWNGESGMFQSRNGTEDWLVVNLQMVNEFENDLMGRAVGDLLWPEWFDAKRVANERVNQGERDWQAKYQGRPQEAEGAIIKRSYWRKWPGKSPPVVEFVLQSWDTAFEEDEENDYSAVVTVGIFDIFDVDNAKVIEEVTKGKKKGEVQQYHAIVVHAWRGKVPFSTLKRNAKDFQKEYEPDLVMIEKKASGHSLIQELRRGGLPIKALKADRSKLARTWAAQPAFEQGCVWHMDIPGIDNLITECAQFPAGENDDWHDALMAAVNRLRRVWHLRLLDEEDTDEEEERKHGAIYG